MAKTLINKEICKGCGLCVIACPKKIIEITKSDMNSKGYNFAEILKMADCIGCAMCAITCPDCAISVEK